MFPSIFKLFGSLSVWPCVFWFLILQFMDLFMVGHYHNLFLVRPLQIFSLSMLLYWIFLLVCFYLHVHVRFMAMLSIHWYNFSNLIFFSFSSLQIINWATQINMNIHTQKKYIPKLQSIISGQSFSLLWLRSLCFKWQYHSAYFLLLF